MKKLLIMFLMVFLFQNTIEAQSYAGKLNFKEQSVTLSTGIDYSIIPVSIDYLRGTKIFNYQYPFIIGANTTIPVFNFDFNDLKIKAKIQTTVFRKKNFDVSLGINPLVIFSKLETQNMTSLGSDFYLATGYSGVKWNFSAEFTYTAIFTTNIQHTDIYKDNVFEDVQNGWYKNTAGNFLAGVLIVRRINQFDVLLSGGISKTKELNNYLFVPSMYMKIGVDIRF